VKSDERIESEPTQRARDSVEHDTPKPVERQWSFAGRFMLWLVGAVVIYVLSIGPAMGVWRRTGPHSDKNEGLVLRFYDPVFLLNETPLGRPLSWWIDFWMVRLHVPSGNGRNNKKSASRGVGWRSPNRITSSRLSSSN
jgi:hypothetical protein